MVAWLLRFVARWLVLNQGKVSVFLHPRYGPRTLCKLILLGGSRKALLLRLLASRCFKDICLYEFNSISSDDIVA